MSKDLLKQLKDSAIVAGAAAPVNTAEAKEVISPVLAAEAVKPVKEKTAPVVNPGTKKRVASPNKSEPALTGFEELYETLKEEKEDFTFGKRLVYIDDDLADILDLIKKEAKINSNLLTSHLLKRFFLENIGLIKALKEKKKGNKFLD